MSQKDKWVRRFSVDETSRHKNGFTIYKITSVLFPIESPETMTVVSVWKRYSDVQRLHKSMRSLHAGLHLRGTFPALTRSSYFKRFQQEVIEERAKTIRILLEFIAEHKLLFTSTDFVNFLQTGYPEPETSSGSVINAIRSSLHLPIEETPPLEYQTSDDDSRSPVHSGRSQPPANSNIVATTDETDFSRIPIFEAADVEICQPSTKGHTLTKSESFESINSLDSISSDLYSELDKIFIDKSKSSVKKTVLPDLIIFDAPSTSSFDDYHTMPKTKSIKSNSETISSNSTSESYDGSYRRSSSRVSMAKSVASLSNVECKTKTEDSYVFQAGYVLNLARRYEDMKEYHSAFECYKAAIEKMLIGVKSDTDSQRRALIKQKINKYLSYAEAIYKKHLGDAQATTDEDELASWFRLLPDTASRLQSPPASMLRRPHAELAQYRVLAVLGSAMALVLHSGTNTCRAMKVLQKVPHNLTEFDEYFLANTEETRQPVLPTVIPYMVPLHEYIETNNLIFLMLSYAPGEKLFDYIENYAKSIPNTPAREVNLENVFAEPSSKMNDVKNDNLDSIIEIKDLNVQLEVKNTEIVNVNENIVKVDEDISIIDRLEQNIDNNNRNMDTKVKTDVLENLEVNDLVINSQKLLLNVDKVLKEVPKSETTIVVSEEEVAEEENTEVVQDTQNVVERRVTTPPKQDSLKMQSPARRMRDVIPPATVCKWGAEILTALESLHNCGVVCIDLNPSNILLGDGGQIILTYMHHYPGLDMRLAKICAAREREAGVYVAPELLRAVCASETHDRGREAVCDYWSFGAIMYWLICGVPLWRWHRGGFAPHSLLRLPARLPLDERSLLTQLLTYEPSERLGGGAGGVNEIKSHPYFRHIDWRHVRDSWVVPD